MSITLLVVIAPVRGVSTEHHCRSTVSVYPTRRYCAVHAMPTELTRLRARQWLPC